MEPLNNIDVIILLCVATSMLVAFVRGFVKEILSILGLILFVVISIYASPFLTDWLKQYVQSVTMARVIVFLVIMAVFYAFWIIGTDKLIARIRTSSLSFMDRLFGLIFGFLRAVIILGFCFLLIKIVLPEELEKGSLKESKYFMMAKPCSDMIEAFLPEDKIKNMVKSVEDMNKVEKKEENKQPKQVDSVKKQEEKIIKELPSKNDQEQMNKMFELLVKPEIRKIANENVKNEEKKVYNTEETSKLDKLIDETIE